MHILDIRSSYVKRLGQQFTFFDLFYRSRGQIRLLSVRQEVITEELIYFKNNTVWVDVVFASDQTQNK